MISGKVAHKILNRVQGILGFYEMIELEKDPNKRAKYFQKVRDEARSLAEYVETHTVVTEKKKQ